MMYHEINIIFMWNLIMNKSLLKDQLQHISNILNERVALYGKRQLETKRAIKAMHRGNIIPSSLILHNMLDAHVNFHINQNGLKTINAILENDKLSISGFSDLEQFFSSSKKLIEIFSDNLINSKLLPLPKEQTQKIIILLFNAVFNYNENIERQNVSFYLKYSYKILIQEIFRKIVILDDNYTTKIIQELKDYYASK